MRAFYVASMLASLQTVVRSDGGGSGHAAISSGYGAPSSGYGAPSGSYSAPSYKAPSYSAPSYAATTASSGGGGLGALLPALAASGLAILGLAALTLPVTTTITSGKKKRSADGNMTTVDQAHLLHNYLQLHGLQQNFHNFDLQKEMVAKYLECGVSERSAEVTSCLQRLVCNYHDKTIRLEAEDSDVAGIIIQTILENKFISKEYKRRLVKAGRSGSELSGSCHKYHCHHNPFFTLAK